MLVLPRKLMSHRLFVCSCNADGKLMVQVTKLYNDDTATQFFAFGRVLSGTLRPGDWVRVLGEGYSLDDEEDMAVKEVMAGLTTVLFLVRGPLLYTRARLF